jgi:hypothetical protein
LHLPRDMSTSLRFASRLLRSASLLALLGASLAACSGESDPTDAEQDFTSAEATLMTFEFDGELVTTQTYDLRARIQDQLLYTIGHLNGNRSVGRLDTTEITDIQTERLEGGLTRVTYHAVMPVGWGSRTNLPTSYDFKLPKRIDFEGLDAFTKKYSARCVDWGAHDVDAGSMWYYYRPARSGCSLDAADIVEFQATATKSAENTEGKYPEYHEVWKDDRLEVIAIFGKYEDGATTTSDAGISAYGNFVDAARSRYTDATTTPADVPRRPGVAHPDVTIEGTLPNGKKVTITALLVDNVSSAPASFYDRYGDLTPSADLIFYNGHAGLGQNVRALAKQGEFEAGRYQIFFMNGCDTFAYVDGHLAQTRAALNPDDPTGTKYMDMVTNVMPSFFSSMPAASMALIDGLSNLESPKTYQEIFAKIDRSEVVVVTGEEDNVFTPGGIEEPWTLDAGGTVARDEQMAFEPFDLPAGKYTIALHEDAAAPGGDADLYVALGRAPTLESYDHRPWLDGSNEQVTLELTEATKVYVMVHGYESMSEASASFRLSGRIAE